MGGLNKISKRMSTKRRVKIEKKVREHNKKLRKQTRTNPKKGKKKKDLGIPNSAPFKDKVLQEIAESKKQEEEERQKRREKMKANRQKNREQKQKQNRNLAASLADAEKRQAEFERKEEVKETRLKDAGDVKSTKNIENSRQTFVKEFKKVVEAADVVLEVLDARDPLGSRCEELEKIVLEKAKKLVLVLNKIDLIPKENVETWVNYLRNKFPTVAFKASTQVQNDHLSQRKVQLSNLTVGLARSSHCLGADVLMKLLANYCRNVHGAIRVGVVGFPNTGKSSLINSLKRNKACTVGGLPGVTKTMQEVNLDKKIKLLDSPGVVMDNSQSPVTAVLRNVVRLEALEDPVPPVEAILCRCSKEQIMLHYNLPDYSNVDEFLSLLARRQGRLKKGGIPDKEKAARAVLQDWTNGRIQYYTQPPEDTSVVSTTICAELGEAFDINAKTFGALPTTTGRSPMLVESLGPAEGIVDESKLPTEQSHTAGTEEEMDDEEWEDEEDEKMEAGEEGKKADEMSSVVVSLPVRRDREARRRAVAASVVSTITANKAQKKAFKKMKRQRKKADITAGKLSSALETTFSAGLGDKEHSEEL